MNNPGCTVVGYYLTFAVIFSNREIALFASISKPCYSVVNCHLNLIIDKK